MNTNITVLSDITSEDFPGVWYGIADENHFWCVERLRVTRKLLKQRGVKLTDTLYGLEIGCGNGLVRRQLMGVTPWTIDGADIDMGALQTNHPQRGETFLYDIYEQREDMKARYDFIILFDVIEHIKEDADFLKTAMFYLKPGGFVLINVPALMSLFSNYDTYVGHYRRYDHAMLTETMQQAGLERTSTLFWGKLMVPILKLRKRMLKDKTLNDDIVIKGFKPPNALANAMLKVYNAMEHIFYKSPSSGTSIMGFGFKPKG